MATQNCGSDMIHGGIYQNKLLMLFLYRGIQHQYSFSLETEVKEAKKFDDLIFKYKQGKQIFYRFIQAKHRKKEQIHRICASELLSENDCDFSLVKYFFSYQDLKEEKLFRDGVIKDVVVCTNINFDMSDIGKSNISLSEMVDKDHILDFCPTNSNKHSVRYKFSKNIASILKPKLENYLLTRLARRLVDCILNNAAIQHHQKNDIFFHYHFVLAKEVIDIKSKKFHDRFITNKNISPTASGFRDKFENELKKKTEDELTLKNLNKAIEDESVLNKKISLQLSKKFGQGNTKMTVWPVNVFDDKDIENYLNHLVFAVNQPNEEELGNLIKDEIGKEYGFISTKYIYHEIFQTTLNLMQGKRVDKFITSDEGNKLLEEAKEEIFLWPSLKYEQELHSVPYSLKRGSELQNFISSGKMLWLMNSETPWLSSLVVYQALNDMNQSYRFLYVPLKFLQDSYKKIIKFRELDLLIIGQISEEDHSNILKAVNVIEDIINSTKGISKKIIFITLKSHEFLGQTNLAKFQYFRENISICFSDLTEEFQRKLLKEKIFDFQRSKESLSLKEILCLGEDIKQEQIEKLDLDCYALEILLQNNRIDLWRKQPSLSDLEEMHYKSNIELEVNQIKQTIHSNPDDVFAFGVNVRHVEEFLRDQLYPLHKFREIVSNFPPKIPRFIYIQNEEEFKGLCRLVDENGNDKKQEISLPVIHFLHKIGSKWMWKDTYDRNVYMNRKLRILNQKQSIFSQKQSILTEEESTKSKFKLTLLVGARGTGKSFTLARIGELIKKEKPSSLVIKVDLKEHQDLFKSNSWKTTSDLVELLLRCDDVDVTEQNSFMRKILAYKLQFPGHVYILWDCLDELETEIRRNVLDLFEYLLKYTETTMWITMRRIDKRVSRNELSTVVYTFATLEEKNQIDYLLKYWEIVFKFTQKKDEQLFVDLLRKQAKEVIDDFRQQISEKLRINYILSIPLILRLFAEAYVKRGTDTLSHTLCSKYFPYSSEKLLLSDFYNYFVNKYFDIYLGNIDVESRSTLKRIYTESYGTLALKKICKTSPKYAKYAKYLEAKENKLTLKTLSIIGLIEEEEYPKFMHPSLAEYFAVELISCSLLYIPTSECIWNLLLNEIMRRKQCRKFFDDKLTSDIGFANLASKSDQREIVYGILSKQTDCSRPLLWRVAADNLKITLVFLTRCAVNIDSLKRISVDILKKCICPRQGCKMLIETFFDYGNELDANRIHEFIVSENSNLLFNAIMKRDTENVNLLMNYVKDDFQIFQIVKSRSPSGKTALHLAANLRDCSIIEKCIEKLNIKQRQILFNTPDVFNRLPCDYAIKYREQFNFKYEEYIWKQKQNISYTTNERQDYKKFTYSFAKSTRNSYSHSNLRIVNLALYFPAFEARKTAIRGSVLTRAFSQFLFLADSEKTLVVIQILEKFYSYVHGKRKLISHSNIRLPKELSSLLNLFINFAEDLDFEDKSLPSKLLIHTDFKTLPCLQNYIRGIKSEVNFAIHLIVNGHVLAIYRIDKIYSFFDRNSIFVSGLRTLDELLSVLINFIKFGAYQIPPIGIFVEHFDVQKANELLTPEYTEAVMSVRSWKESVLTKKSLRNFFKSVKVSGT